MTEVRTEKTIRLTGLHPDNYRLWAAQSESTFRVHGVLDIVLGREPNPERAVLSTPSDESSSDADVAQARPVTAAQRKAIEKWQHRHDLAHQALLACLQPAELTKVYQFKSAHEIWKRLADEYGPVSDIRRAQATSEFYSLQKKSSKSMQEHINEFTRLQQEVNYHRDSLLSNIDVNLAFLQSLGESWKTFQHSMGPRLNTITPPTLFAEVLAFEASNRSAASEPSSNAHALHIRRQYSNQHTKFKPYDHPKNACRYCKRKGHTINECLKKQWSDTQAKEEIENGDVEYDWK